MAFDASVPACRSWQRVLIRGGIDNKSAEALSYKMLSTKVPVMFVLTELWHQCNVRHIRCSLDWRSREENVEADDLTSERYQRFVPSKRISVKWSELELPILEAMVRFVAGFEHDKKLAAGMPDGTAKGLVKSSWG